MLLTIEVLMWFCREISRRRKKSRKDCGWIKGVVRRVSNLGHDDVFIYAGGSLGYLVSLMGGEWLTRRGCNSESEYPPRRAVRLVRVQWTQNMSTRESIDGFRRHCPLPRTRSWSGTRHNVCNVCFYPIQRTCFGELKRHEN